MIELTGHKGPVVALAYSPDGRTLASASADGTARLWDLATGKLTATLQSPAARAHCVAFARDGKSLAVGYGQPHGLLQMWDVRTTQQQATWAANRRITRGVAFHPFRSWLATAGDSLAVRVWQADVQLFALKIAPTNAVTFSPNGEFLAAVTSRHGTVRLWISINGQPYRSLKNMSEWGYALAFHPNGDRLLVGLEGMVALWNPADYRPPHVWPAHAGAVLGVAFTPDGETLLTGGADGLVKLWDPAGRLRHTFDWKIREVGAVAFAPDGLTAAAGGAETILVWDVAG
jgi:WD40 repeat protein